MNESISSQDLTIRSEESVGSDKSVHSCENSEKDYYLDTDLMGTTPRLESSPLVDGEAKAGKPILT